MIGYPDEQLSLSEGSVHSCIPGQRDDKEAGLTPITFLSQIASTYELVVSFWSNRRLHIALSVSLDPSHSKRIPTHCCSRHTEWGYLGEIES